MNRQMNLSLTRRLDKLDIADPDDLSHLTDAELHRMILETMDAIVSQSGVSAPEVMAFMNREAQNYRLANPEGMAPEALWEIVRARLEKEAAG